MEDIEKLRDEIIDKTVKKMEGKFLTMDEAQKLIESVKAAPQEKGDFFELVSKELKEGTRIIKAGEGLSGVTPGSGLIPTSVAKTIYSLADENAWLLKAVTVIPASDMKISIGYEIDGDEGAFVDVGTAVTASNTQVNIMNFNAHRWSKGQYIDKKLVEHATPDIVKWLFKSYSRAFNKALYNKLVTGTGTGEPYGLNSYSGIQAVTFTAGSSIDYDTIADAFLSLPKAYREEATFIGSSAFVKQAYKIKDADGKPIFDINNGTIFGRPVYEHPALADGSTAGDIVAYIVHLPSYYLLLTDKAEFTVVAKDVSTVSRGQEYAQLDLYVDGMLASTDHAVVIKAA